MKLLKNVFILFSFFVIVNCTDGFIEEGMLSNGGNFPTKISLEEAIAYAKSMRSQSFSSTRNAISNSDVASVAVWGMNQDFKTRSGNAIVDLPDTMMYVVNFADSAGFVIVSADTRAGTVLACVEKGNFNFNDSIGNKGLNFFMARLKKHLIGVFSDSISHPDPSPHDPPFIIDSLISPLLVTKWGQNDPYNMYCPVKNDTICPTGCVATAIAQLATYHEHPDSCREHVYDWFWMKLMPVPTYDEAKKSTARLMRDIGDITNTDYQPKESGCDNSRIAPCLSFLGYNHAFGNYDFGTCYNELENNRPVLVYGIDSVNGGHIWVIDGILIQSHHVLVGFGNSTIGRIHIQRLVHCNWGFNGNFNGYFLSDVFDTSKRVRESDVTRGNYSVGVRMWYNICPINTN